MNENLFNVKIIALNSAT